MNTKEIICSLINSILEKIPYDEKLQPQKVEPPSNKIEEEKNTRTNNNRTSQDKTNKVTNLSDFPKVDASKILPQKTTIPKINNNNKINISHGRMESPKMSKKNMNRINLGIKITDTDIKSSLIENKLSTNPNINHTEPKKQSDNIEKKSKATKKYFPNQLNKSEYNKNDLSKKLFQKHQEQIDYNRKYE